MMRLNWIALPLLLALTLSGCGATPSVPSDSPTITLGQEFQVAAGRTATLPAANVRVVFNGVSEDSRCPSGVQCAWAGQAVVQISVYTPDGKAVGYNLLLGGTRPNDDQATSGAYTIRLRALDPLPSSESEAVKPANYVATLLMTRK